MSYLPACKPTRFCPSGRGTGGRSAVPSRAPDSQAPTPTLRSGATACLGGVTYTAPGGPRTRTALRATVRLHGPPAATPFRLPARLRSARPETFAPAGANSRLAFAGLPKIGTPDDPTDARISVRTGLGLDRRHRKPLHQVRRRLLAWRSRLPRRNHPGTRAKTRARSSPRFSVRLRGPPSSAPLRLPDRSAPHGPRLRAGR